MKTIRSDLRVSSQQQGKSGLSAKIFGVCDAAGRLLDFLTPG